VLKRTISTTPGMEERFRREALLLSTVDHPNVVRVLDFEMGPDGTALVLEYVDGQRLALALEDGKPLPLARAVKLLRQLAVGLAAIHDRGIVHRDLKPENVVLAPGPDGEVARILDFGVARLLAVDEAPADGRDFVTQAGVGTGTPAYISPEQVLGLPPTPRSDIYAFGCTAYLLLAGRLPFNGPNLEDYLKQHTEVEPPSLATWAPEVAAAEPELAKLVLRCLSKKPDERPTDGRALLYELDRAVNVDARVAAPGKSGGNARWVAAFAVAVCAGLLPVAAVLQPWTAEGQADTWLALGQPLRALSTLGAEAPDEPVQRSALRLRALHAAGQTDAMRVLLAQRCVSVLVAAQPAVRPESVRELLPAGAEGEACAKAAERAVR